MDINFPQNPGVALPIATEPVSMARLAENRDMIQAVRTVNSAGALGDDRELAFLLDRETQRPIMRIVNRQTHEVIQQVPPEYVLRMAEELRRQMEK
jgi:uncharacterized FlaG/YvyC family protein